MYEEEVRPTHPPTHPPTYLLLTIFFVSYRQTHHPPTHPPTHLPTQQSFCKPAIEMETFLCDLGASPLVELGSADDTVDVCPQFTSWMDSLWPALCEEYAKVSSPTHPPTHPSTHPLTLCVSSLHLLDGLSLACPM